MERVVGEYYRVPVVDATFSDVPKWETLPVLGSWHEDGEYIGFSDYHYHVDSRFVSDRWLRRHNTYPHNIVLTIVKNLRIARRKCKRAMSVFPLRPYSKTTPVFPKLHAAFANSYLGPHRQCPHKGFSLAGLAPINGVLVCPLHSLCFDVATGKNIDPDEAWHRMGPAGQNTRRRKY